MQTPLFVASALAGFAYGITPGPGVLAVFGIGAARGRLAGAAFLAGHFFGDLLWYTLALASIVGVTEIGPTVFTVLGLVSGVYLLYLGVRALGFRPGPEEAGPQNRRNALVQGILFGFTNPKSYPVAAAMFTALLADKAEFLTWDAFPALVGAAGLGSLAAYAALVFVVGIAAVRRIYRRHETWFVRLSGLVFVLFGAKSVADSLRSLPDGTPSAV